ncbi:monocarboxylate transporter 2-like [Paramacrobiotus metropolitanus]|uniref:monocarboxylate transporter 2-like n=1 Tax=Paramacrobiotus metropolitanus TaxID=2943436 RepID=UPI0024463AD9|nr:monocarboxylate transporter 2-like [Paramacrobiotus metropolitanus]
MVKTTATYVVDAHDGEEKVALKPPSSEKTPARAAPIVVAPDGGYGWVILVASFAINVIVDGIVFSFGMLLNPLIEQFSQEAVVPWAGSLQSGCYLLAGPVVSGLCNKYGARLVSVVGSFIVAAAMATSAFASELWQFIVLYGLVSGIGFGFVYLPAIVIVGVYFDKRRAFATGLAVAGSGIGGFMFPPIIEPLLEYYGWRGTVLIMAGIALNCAIFAALFRPLLPTHRPEEADTEMHRSESFLKRIEAARNARINMLNSNMDVSDQEGAVTPRQGIHLENITESEMEPESGQYSVKTVEITYQPRSAGNINESDAIRMSSTGVLHRAGSRERSLERRFSSSSRKSIPSESPAPFTKPDVLYSGSVHNLPEVRQFGGSIHDFRASLNAIDAEKNAKRNKSLAGSARRIIGQMLDVSLLRSPTFLLTCVTSFMTLAGFFVPFVFIKAFVSERGITDSEATWVLMSISVTNTIGRIVVGFISDMPKVDPIVVACSALIVGGICTVFFPLMSTMALFVTYALIFGLSISAFAALRSIILVDLFGIAMLNNSFGLQMLFQGIAALVGSPIAGALAKATGSKDSTFYFAGVLIGVSGALLFPAKLVLRWERRRFPGSAASKR